MKAIEIEVDPDFKPEGEETASIQAKAEILATQGKYQAFAMVAALCLEDGKQLGILDLLPTSAGKPTEARALLESLGFSNGFLDQRVFGEGGLADALDTDVSKDVGSTGGVTLTDLFRVVQDILTEIQLQGAPYMGGDPCKRSRLTACVLAAHSQEEALRAKLYNG